MQTRGVKQNPKNLADVIQVCSLEVLEEEEEHGGHRLHDDLLVAVHVDALIECVSCMGFSDCL